MATADFVINVLADTSSAQGSVNGLVNALAGSVNNVGGGFAKALGIGAAAAVTAEMTKASMDIQDAMARVQASYNSVDFAPGTQKFDDAKVSIQRFAETTATDFKTAAAVYAQGTRFLDEGGQRLPTDKLNEYTDTMLKVSKVSTDALAPEVVGQKIDVLAKLFSNPDDPRSFKQIGSEVTGLSGIHNLGEGPGLEGAIAIGQVGADIGVTLEQSLGIGNYLAGLQLGGQMGGSSVGRMLQRMGQGVDKTLNPEEQYSETKRNRDAAEKESDLQGELAIAEQKRSEMYGQHGLKTQYKKDPAAVMEADQRIAKLQREINDQQQDMAHMGGAKPSQSVANVGEMAKLIGMDKTEYAKQFESDPMGALLEWTHALSELPENQKQGAMTKAFGGRGVLNVRDQRIIEALANPGRQGEIQHYLDTANEQMRDPTDIDTRSSILLGTTSAHVTEAGAAIHGTAAELGEPSRQGLDLAAQKLTESGEAVRKFFEGMGSGGEMKMALVEGVVVAISAAIPSIITAVLTGKALSGLSGLGKGGTPGTPGAPADWTPSDLERIRNGGLGKNPARPFGTEGPVNFGNFAGAGLMTAAAFMSGDIGKGLSDNLVDTMRGGQLGDGIKEWALQHTRSAEERAAGPPGVDIGGIHIQAGYSLQDVINLVSQQITMAWFQAQAGEPVSGQVGGNTNVTGQGPR